MLPSAQSHWVALRWRLRSDGLWLSYEDSVGTRISPPRRAFGYAPEWRRFLLRDGDGPPVLVPYMLGEHLRARQQQLPDWQSGRFATGPVPLAVYVQSRPALPERDGEDLASEVLARELEPDRIQLVRLPYRPWVPRTPFRLPFRILAADDAAGAAAQALYRMGWLGTDTVQQYGLQIHTRPWGEPVSVSLQRTPYDIVIAERGEGDWLLRRLAHGMPRGEKRPRLIVSLEPGAPGPTLPLPAGVSLLRVPGGDTAVWTAEFILGLVHDQPLHEAVRSAQRTRGQGLIGEPVLIADPATDEALRIGDARFELREELTRLRIQSAPFIRTLRESTGMAVPNLQWLQSAVFDEESAVSFADIASRSAEFALETTGLHRLADAEAALEQARMTLDKMRALSTPDVSLGVVEERRVDVAMERSVAPGVFDAIKPEKPLQQGELYRLRVHVGTPLPESLVVGDVPPIDILLPAPDNKRGHELEVVVFPKTFQLLSAAVQPVRLPLRGSTDPVFFTLRAPAEGGHAELRIGVYHRGHMVQSFLLTAPVGESSDRSRDRVQVRLNFAATERLVEAQLDMLGERALSVAVNQDAIGGSHTFMVKRGANAEAFTLDPKLVDQQVSAFRKLLEDATFVPPIVPGQETARFNTYPEAGAETDADFHKYVRRLADFGRMLYDLLRTRVSGAMHKEILGLERESDRVIQVVRHDANMAFPWGIFYDYPLPQARSGALPRPVCLGAPLEQLGLAKASKRRLGCPHNKGHDVYCIEGFWGVRHRIEQRIGMVTNAETAVLRPASQPGVMLAASIDDEIAAELAARLDAELGDQLAVLRKQDDLLDLLWDPACRPAVLVVLGHLETGETTGEPKGPRIVLLPKSNWPPPDTVPDEHWLMPGAVSGMSQQRGRWEDDPRTLVLLMACSSAATEVGTVNDLVTTLTPVGVGAVVGTETPVFTRLAARFAAEVTLALWTDSECTLGKAVQKFNRALIRSGNPLAFAFTCIGNADLTISP